MKQSVEVTLVGWIIRLVLNAWQEKEPTILIMSLNNKTNFFLGLTKQLQLKLIFCLLLLLKCKYKFNWN